MLHEEVRARLELLNRQRLPDHNGAADSGPCALDRPHAPALLSPAESQAGETDLSLSALAPGRVEYGPAGCHWLVRHRVADLWHGAVAIGGHSSRHTPCAVRPDDPMPGDSIHPEIAAFVGGFPRDVLFLDLETCGFAGSPIFLAGVVYQDERELVLEQLLARDYTEERALLAALGELARSRPVLVTFNGKSFDWPMVRDRSAYHRLGVGDESSNRNGDGHGPSVSGPAGPVHCDLLHHARRRWRRRLPNCKLQTLERFLCRRLRRDDISGSRIGQEYHYFVRSGDARSMQVILHHNALDLITLVELAMLVSKSAG
ncbi:MAG: ribonuclease H-like domain-containing protein [Pirellulales bacterium]